MGCYIFRQFCDELIEQNRENSLKNIKFALLGLGDSSYTTFFDNPTTIDKAMILAGAKRVGTVGKADASGDQLAIIAKWIDDIWPLLKQAISEKPPCDDDLANAQSITQEICNSFAADFEDSDSSKNGQMSSFIYVAAAIVLCIIAIILKRK
eukprot:CAMPEP_0171298390 /NCGR_PEP_ID=MMETSP0816-20121228/7180_1 /TAXON_ID=420281 /ORGANISM="Proboscia inermis, Strain CCAP1064/1" /LENGTH=151 /DNA_ID=CAMNT_0011773407 /DNA_START=266 /DNA_END=721 /DNA_ORIENTATION=+